MNNDSLEIRSADSTRKFRWMAVLAKNPELADLMFEIAEMSSEEKKFLVKVMRTVVDQTQLFSMMLKFNNAQQSIPFQEPVVSYHVQGNDNEKQFYV